MSPLDWLALGTVGLLAFIAADHRRAMRRLDARDQRLVELTTQRRDLLERSAAILPCCGRADRPPNPRPHTRTGDCLLRPLKDEPGYVG